MALGDRVKRLERQLRPPEPDGYDPCQYEDPEEAREKYDAMLREAFGGRYPSDEEHRRFINEVYRWRPGAPVPDPSDWRDRAILRAR